MHINFLTTAFLITVVPAVVELVTHPVLRNTTPTGTRELIPIAAWIRCKKKQQNSRTQNQSTSWCLLKNLRASFILYHSLVRHCRPRSRPSGRTQTSLGYRCRLCTETGGLDSAEMLQMKQPCSVHFRRSVDPTPRLLWMQFYDWISTHWSSGCLKVF